ncbi:MAG: carboxylating nicotinate-nucleotide diphosphorylase [Nitrososphaeria archaeon]
MKSTFERMLEEDSDFGDITSECTIPEELEAEAKVIAKEDGVVAGLKYLSGELDKLGLKAKIIKDDGEYVGRGDVVASIEGNARKILLIERTFLNILGRMSGIATATRRVVTRVKEVNSHTRIAATRKTILGRLDKEAVVIGGGDPHRWNLSDHILIKDNHIALVGLEEAIKRAKKTSFVRKIEVEVESTQEAAEAVDLGADIILLDNFKPEQIYKTIKMLEEKGVKEKVLLEASGGINEENVTEYARCGVDIISMGYLTHSTKNMDYSMEIEAARR